VQIKAIAAAAARTDRRIVIESLGRDAAGDRFDAWELAAARAAAIARALQQGGVAEARMRIVMPPQERQDGQRLAIRYGA
jgi:hypothetical protein